ERGHTAGGQLKTFRCPRQDELFPLLAPFPEGGSQVTQATKREQVRGQRHEDRVGREQGRTVDRAQVGTHVDQGDVRIDTTTRFLDNSVESRRGAQRLFVPPESFGPVRGKFVLEPAQLQVSRDQPQVLGHFEGINGSDVSLPPDNRFDRLGYG